MKGIRTTISTAACFVGLALILAPAPAAADHVIYDDLIVDGSACVGFDCINGESFGYDTIRLKEHNLRIHFMDTSSAASYPDTDWRIVINDSTNGGGHYFAVEDASSSRVPFKIEAGARTNSLYVDDGGRLGLRTSTPSTEIHIIDGDTPTVRLQQDGSSGFAPHTWDVAGNETNFFIRDVTEGSTLPLRIRPGAPTSSIDVHTDGEVGIGTSSPDEEMHLYRSDAGPTRIMVENSGANQVGFLVKNSSVEWSFTNTGAGAFVINDTADAGDQEFNLSAAGDLTIGGSIFTDDCSPCVSDYVFEPGYELMPLAQLEEFIQRQGHLPNVPSQGDVDRAGKLNMTQMQMRMLEKIEELVLYTIEQQSTLVEQQSTIEALQQRIDDLEGR